MSLSKKILHEPIAQLAAHLKTQPPLDVIDEYGYTPLIQTAIINDAAKARLLLEHGAQIDFPDLTGRTALFWAADNNNQEFCELALQYHANPNAYSRGGQPILVMPLIKKQLAITNLLLAAGASLDFAYDFLNAKQIGHGFELEGRVDIVDPTNLFIEVELEGFYLRFTLEAITSSLLDFRQNFAARNLREYFPYLDTVITAMQHAARLLRWQHYLIDIQTVLDEINFNLTTDPLILPIAFGGHAISLIKIGDNLIRCDRGEYGREHGTVIYYAIGEPNRFTKELRRKLLYQRQYPETINQALVEHLVLQPYQQLNLPAQKTGNCTWANVEAIIPALLLALFQNRPHRTPIADPATTALHIYQEWQEWNKNRSLEFCIQKIPKANPARRATKAALLAAILFQACDNNTPQTRARAAKILKILTQNFYTPVLKNYVKTFSQERTLPLWKNFCNLLENCGIDLEKLRG